MNYKQLSNKRIELRFYSKNKIKRLYVDKMLSDKYIYISDNRDGLIVHIGCKNNGLKVNKQGFVSLNRLSDKAWNSIKDKQLCYDMKIKAMLSDKQ